MDPPPLKIAHFALAFIPVALTPAVVFILAESWFDFGGGEKDIMLAIPYFTYAFIFLVIASVGIVKRWPLKRWVFSAAWMSALVFVLLGIVLFGYSGISTA